MIEYYRFGSVTVGGKEISGDLKIINGKLKNWEYVGKSHHEISMEDFKELFDENPEVIYVGTGAWGRAKVDEDVVKLCREKNIELVLEETACVIERINNEKRKYCALLHLTC